ncbi:MAG: helix-turn-helix transcriptional regulator [Betaproteobacteria bacterium]|nr:helix-turn-helix transcriptional regulator [Betaproteobacteria bacterium]
MDVKDVVKALGALAHESRLTVFRMLVEAGPDGMTPGVIGERTGIPPATLSFHLKELANAGLIASSPQGRFLIYAPDFERMNEVVAFLTENCCSGHPEHCLPAIAIVAAPKKRVRS